MPFTAPAKFPLSCSLSSPDVPPYSDGVSQAAYKVEIPAGQSHASDTQAWHMSVGRVGALEWGTPRFTPQLPSLMAL